MSSEELEELDDVLPWPLSESTIALEDSCLTIAGRSGLQPNSCLIVSGISFRHLILRCSFSLNASALELIDEVYVNVKRYQDSLDYSIQVFHSHSTSQGAAPRRFSFLFSL